MLDNLLSELISVTNMEQAIELVDHLLVASPSTRREQGRNNDHEIRLVELLLENVVLAITMKQSTEHLG